MATGYYYAHLRDGELTFRETMGLANHRSPHSILSTHSAGTYSPHARPTPGTHRHSTEQGWPRIQICPCLTPFRVGTRPVFVEGINSFTGFIPSRLFLCCWLEFLASRGEWTKYRKNLGMQHPSALMPQGLDASVRAKPSPHSLCEHPHSSLQ